MDHTSCFVDTKLTKVQFFSMFSANIYLAHKVVMNLEKTNTLGIGNTCFKKQCHRKGLKPNVAVQKCVAATRLSHTVSLDQMMF